jgi:antitoxin component YwqK of YwqJK toxin-antitoxin module
MKFPFLLGVGLAILFPVMAWGQKVLITDTLKSTYKDLQTLKTYAVNSSSLISADTSWFKLNDNNVDEKTYRKFSQYVSAYDQCRPCVMLSFDTSERLRYKSISYGDCRVGYWIEYYPDGKVKVIGHYKENETGNWDNLFARGYCREDGIWTYFNSKGSVTCSEIWKEGKRLKKTVAKRK